MEEHVKNTDK